MIRAMRSGAKWIMGVLVVAFVGWMVFDVGMGATGGGSYRAGDAIAKVNGERIDLQTYYAALRDAQERQRQQTGSAPLTQEGQRALENSVMENLVQRILLQEEYQKRGIRVSDEEIMAAAQNSPPPELMNNPAFQTEGQFDVAKYRRFLSSRTDPNFLLGLEALYREEIPRAKLFQQLVSDVYLSDARLWQAYRDQNDSVTARILTLYPDAVVPDSAVHVSDAEVEAYYDKHRDAFTRVPVAYLSYLMVERAPDAADSAAALKHAREVREEVVQGGDFAAIALRESADSGSAVQGGDLGEVTRGRFVSEFEKAVFALKLGQVSQPVLSGFGYHIIKLESRSGDKYHARHILIPIQLTGRHLDEVDAKVDSLDRHAAEQADPAALDTAAAMIGAKVRQAEPVREGERVDVPPYQVPDAGLWAFQARTGETSQVIETDNADYVFRLDSLTPGGVLPLADIREVVRRRVISDKKREAARQLAAGLSNDVATGRATLDDIAKRYRAPIETVGPFTRTNPPSSLSNDPALVGTAFGVPVGKVSNPVVGDRAVYLLEAVRRQPADSAAFARQLPQQRQQALQVAQQNRVRTVLGSLRASADVVDHRQDLERAQREAEERQERIQQTQTRPGPRSP